MKSASEAAPAKRSAARDRLLDTASRLFYDEGINTVGVDRIVSESQVTLATFYRHFPGKEALAVAYLQAAHESVAEYLQTATATKDGRARVRALSAAVAAELDNPTFRGCAFNNAASEFEDPQSAVRQVITRHRQWYLDFVKQSFAGAGHERPGNAARHFLMLRDGAMVAASLDSRTAAKRTFNRGVEGLLRSIDISSLGDPDDDDAMNAP